MFKQIKMIRKSIVILVVTTVLGCKNNKVDNGKLNVVVTTTMLTDLVKNIGGDFINLQGLMGAGVDPHLYKASEGDVSKLFNADVIFIGERYIYFEDDQFLEISNSDGSTYLGISSTNVDIECASFDWYKIYAPNATRFLVLLILMLFRS